MLDCNKQSSLDCVVVLPLPRACCLPRWAQRIVIVERRETAEQVSACEQVFALDLLGFGRSDKPLLGYTLELWRDLVLDFLREVAAGAPAVLVGNSLGSLICLNVRPASGVAGRRPWVRDALKY